LFASKLQKKYFWHKEPWISLQYSLCSDGKDAVFRHVFHVFVNFFETYVFFQKNKGEPLPVSSTIKKKKFYSSIANKKQCSWLWYSSSQDSPSSSNFSFLFEIRTPLNSKTSQISSSTSNRPTKFKCSKAFSKREDPSSMNILDLGYCQSLRNRSKLLTNQVQIWKRRKGFMSRKRYWSE